MDALHFIHLHVFMYIVSLSCALRLFVCNPTCLFLHYSCRQSWWTSHCQKRYRSTKIILCMQWRGTCWSTRHYIPPLQPFWVTVEEKLSIHGKVCVNVQGLLGLWNSGNCTIKPFKWKKSRLKHRWCHLDLVLVQSSWTWITKIPSEIFGTLMGFSVLHASIAHGP